VEQLPDSFDPRPILRALRRHQVDFVLIGGLAGSFRGSAYPTYDVDIAYERSMENLERLVAALGELEASLRGAPDDVPFLLDARSIAAGSHFTFRTREGDLDILSNPDGAPAYSELKHAAGPPLTFEGEPLLVASLDHLIAMKEAAARPKDKLMAMEYRGISDLLRTPKEP
jgi:hypothetical protein